MKSSFGEALRRIRTEKGISQQQLAEMLYVDRSSIAGWETGRRVPDFAMIQRISKCLGTDISTFVNEPKRPSKVRGIPNVVIIDDEKIILAGSERIIRKALPKAHVTSFTKPTELLEFARSTTVSLAFLDIELGQTSGLELCEELLKINPNMNIIFLTAYSDYAFEAWKTGACGFLTKPLTEDDVMGQLKRLRYSVPGL
ncbi:MAG: response regulator [Clostridiales bacterium]|nr:response regulator [Clostridiales bacterium]